MDPTICVAVTWHDSIPSAVPDPGPRFFKAEIEEEVVVEVEVEVEVVVEVARDGNETTDDDDEEDVEG